MNLFCKDKGDNGLNILIFNEWRDDNQACAVCSSYKGTYHNHITGESYCYKGCDIILHPVPDCKIEPVTATVQLIHHEIIHNVLKTEVGEQASHKWDNIAGVLTGCPCDGSGQP